jgi:hypothetical protein
MRLVDHEVGLRRLAVEVADGFKLANKLVGPAHQCLGFVRRKVEGVVLELRRVLAIRVDVCSLGSSYA